MPSSRVIIVTGASSGLGRAIALEFAQQELTRVVICADLVPNAPSTSQEARATHEEIQATFGAHKAIFIKTDVSQASEMQNLIQTAVSTYNRLDVLVNNAGIALESHNNMGPRPVHETEESTYTRTMEVNTKSVFLGCKYAVEQFRKQDVDPCGSRGFIVNTSSVYGLVGADGHVSYCSSKGAVIQMTRAIAVENAPFKIHCNAVCPGFIQTGMDSKLYSDPKMLEDAINLHPWGTLGEPKDVAHAVAFLASDKASWITGVILPVDGGYTSI